MATVEGVCGSCGAEIVYGVTTRLNEEMRLLEDLGRTFVGVPKGVGVCHSCAFEMLLVGADLLQSRHGTAALCLCKMEDVGLTRIRARRRGQGKVAREAMPEADGATEELDRRALMRRMPVVLHPH